MKWSFTLGIVFFWTTIPLATCYHILCMGHSPYPKTPDPNLPNDDVTKYKKGYHRTIGSQEYTNLNQELMKEYQESWTFQRPGPIAKPYFTIQMYQIKVDGYPLRGWVHLVIKLNKDRVKDHSIGILQLNGLFYYVGNTNYGRIGGNGAGEFVANFPACSGHETIDKLPRHRQFLPCGGIPPIQQTVPWGFTYVKAAPGVSTSTTNDLIPPDDKIKEFHLNFRYSSQPCNHPIMLKIFGLVLFADAKCTEPRCDDLVHEASDEIIFNQEEVIGAADPIPRIGTYTKITCDTRIDVSGRFSFINEVRLDQLAGESIFACAPDTTNKYYDKDKTKLFAGRCSGDGAASFAIFPPATVKENRLKAELNANPSNVNKCSRTNSIVPKDPVTKKDVIDYDDYIQRIHDNMAKPCSVCPTVPPRPRPTISTTTTLATTTKVTTTITTTTSALTTTTTKTTVTTEYLTTPIPMLASHVNNEKLGIRVKHALNLWDTRILHGVCMTILAILVSPVNIFISRYFKETYMDTRVMFLQLWYLVHHMAIAFSLILYFSGMFRLMHRRRQAGQSLSEAALFHRYIGWGSIWITIGLVIFGGLRPINRRLRTCCIAVHWTLGMTVYVCNYIAMFISIQIPGSPSATTDVNADIFSNEVGKQHIRKIIIAWIVFDIIMHLSMTVHICKMDVRLGLTRPRYWIPTPLNVLPEHDVKDLPGAGFRKQMFGAYGLVATITTIVICNLMWKTQPGERGLGEMSCTHEGKGGGLKDYGGSLCD